MAHPMQALVDMEYPGRVIIMGSTGPHEFVYLYGLTGRSEPSRERVLRRSGSFVYVDTTNPDATKSGDVDLLLYNAIAIDPMRVVISNGAQTDLIRATARIFFDLPNFGVEDSREARQGRYKEILETALMSPYPVRKKDGGYIDITSYEPDEIKTPRISGLRFFNVMTMCIAKRLEDGDGTAKSFFVLGGNEYGTGRMLATYDGRNDDIPPAFEGNPRQVQLEGSCADMVDTFFDALGEFRVSAACITSHNTSIDTSIRNIHGNNIDISH